MGVKLPMLEPMKIFAAASLFVVLSGLLIWKWGEASQLRGELSQATQREEGLRAELDVSKSKAQAQMNDKRSAEQKTLTKSSEEAQASQKAGRPGAEKNPLAEFGAALAALMTDEKSKQALKDLSEGALAEANASLLEMLNLSPEQKKRFLEALAEAKQQDDAMGLRFLTAGTMTAEQKEAFLKEMAEVKKANKERLEGALGDPEKVAQYQSFKDSQPERDLLAAMKKPMEGGGQPLSDGQEQQLMDLIYKERKAYQWEHNYLDEADMNPEKFTDGAIDRLWQQVADFDTKTDPRIAQILSPEQMQIFAGQRTQIRAVHKLGLNLMKGLFSNSQ